MLKAIGFVLVGCLVASGVIADDKKTLQGVWIGKEIGKEDQGNVRLEISGEKLEFQGWNENEWYKGTFDLARQDDLHKLFATIKDCPAPQLVGKTCNGIYELDGNTLTVVSRGPGDPEEPSGFDDPKCRKLVLKRR